MIISIAVVTSEEKALSLSNVDSGSFVCLLARSMSGSEVYEVQRRGEVRSRDETRMNEGVEVAMRGKKGKYEI